MVARPPVVVRRTPSPSALDGFQPGASTVTPTAIRLTRRGRLVISTCAVFLALAVVIGSWLSQRGDEQVPPASTPAHVAVAPGDTLWSIAVQVAPGRDPRAEISDLLRINHLGGADLSPGQVLRTG